MMTKRLLVSSVIALGALAGLTGCGQASVTHHTSTQTAVANITSTGHTVHIETKTGTQDSGIAQVTMLGPSEYQYALPITNGSVQATLIVPWSGKTSVAVTDGSKTLEILDATVKGQPLSEQQLDLLPSYLMDSNIPTVADKAHAIASAVSTQGAARNQAVASTTMQWVKTHIRKANQSSRADQTLASDGGNQESRMALAVALLRADNIPAKPVQKQVMSHGLYGTNYSVDVWLNGKWTNMGTP